MSELFTILQKISNFSQRKNANFKCCKLAVFSDGTMQVLVDGELLAYGFSENEFLANAQKRIDEETARHN